MAEHLVIGGDSTIGNALAAMLRERGETVAVTSRRAGASWRLDLSDSPEGWRFPQRVDTAYLCAAVTSLAACEADPDVTHRVNVTHTVELAQRLAHVGARVLLLSTNQVFDGSTERPGVVAPLRPVSAYGRQKAAAEAGLSGAASVVRLTKLLGPTVPLFEAWAERWKRHEPVTAFGDMVFAPVTLDHAVRSILDAGTGAPRVMHVSASHDVTYYAAALRLAARLGVDASLVREGAWRDAGLDPRHVPRHTALAATAGGAPSPWEAIDEAAEALTR